MTDREECAYLAGLWDGEGCFNLRRREATVISQFNIAMTDSIGMEMFRARYGGRVYNKPRGDHKPQVQYLVPKGSRRRFLADLLPFLRVKCRQAELMWKFPELFPH